MTVISYLHVIKLLQIFPLEKLILNQVTFFIEFINEFNNFLK